MSKCSSTQHQHKKWSEKKNHEGRIQQDREVEHDLIKTNKEHFSFLKYTGVSQVLRDDDICDSIEDKADITSVSGTCCMSIDGLPFRVFIQLHELVTDELDAGLIVGSP